MKTTILHHIGLKLPVIGRGGVATVCAVRGGKYAVMRGRQRTRMDKSLFRYSQILFNIFPKAQYSTLRYSYPLTQLHCGQYTTAQTFALGGIGRKVEVNRTSVRGKRQADRR